MYIIVKNLSKGSKKNTRNRWNMYHFHLRELCYNHADDIL